MCALKHPSAQNLMLLLDGVLAKIDMHSFIFSFKPMTSSILKNIKNEAVLYVVCVLAKTKMYIQEYL